MQCLGTAPLVGEIVVGEIATAAGAALTLLAACGPVKKAPQTRTAEFGCTGAAQYWVVPPG